MDISATERDFHLKMKISNKHKTAVQALIIISISEESTNFAVNPELNLFFYKNCFYDKKPTFSLITTHPITRTII